MGVGYDGKGFRQWCGGYIRAGKIFNWGIRTGEGEYRGHSYPQLWQRSVKVTKIKLRLSLSFLAREQKEIKGKETKSKLSLFLFLFIRSDK
jgi:hypothetical protein